jgi:hypothetical protein
VLFNAAALRVKRLTARTAASINARLKQLVSSHPAVLLILRPACEFFDCLAAKATNNA